MLILIGSHALNHWLPGYRQNPSDLDYIATLDDFVKWCEGRDDIESVYPISQKIYVVHTKKNGVVEFEIAHPHLSAYMMLESMGIDGSGDLMVTIPTNGNRGQTAIIPNLDWLFTLKASHRYLKDSPHFLKTLQDYHFLKRLGCKVTDTEFLRRREQETYRANRPRLNRAKKDFFSGDGVKYIYDHDSLHEAVKIGNLPAYKYYAQDGHDVFSSRKKFFDLPFDVRINGVLEESYVLALERSQIPYREQIKPRDSFMIALSKVCTSITSGWFREFAYENWFEVMRRYDDTYVALFDNALENGVVKPYEQPVIMG